MNYPFSPCKRAGVRIVVGGFLALFTHRSPSRRRNDPLRGGLRARIDRRRASACFEWLEARQMLASSAFWAGGTSGYWNVAANWSNDAVPTPTTTVSIASSGATVTIPPGYAASAGSLAIAAGAALSMPEGVNSANPTTNWIVDADFESPTLPSQLWTWGSAGSSVSLSAQYAYTGSQSLVLSGASSTAVELFAATPGSSYTTSVYAMTPNPLTGNATAYLNLYFFNSSYTQISSYYTAPNSIAVLTASSATGGPLAGSVGNQGWNHFSTTAVAPAGTAYVEAQVETAGGAAGTSAYFDDLELGPTPPGAQGPATLVVGSASIPGNISNSGALTVGPTNTATIIGSFAQTSTGTLDVQLGGAPSTDNFGLVNISGAATLAGALEADIVNGYSPATTDTFTPIEFASESGGFAGETLPSGAGYKFNAAVSFTNVMISAAPTTALTATVNASTSLHPATTNLLGVNTVYWDSDAATTQTRQMATAAGLDIYRFPGGSAADDFHFDVADNWGDSGAITISQFAQFVASVGGTGVVTVDYGSGSPQEAEAELAYLDGSPSNTTPIASGIQWNDAANAWQTTPWKTVGYWASLRGESPLATDDGYNFMRIDHPAPFANIEYWEIGNEEYGSWEVDHHGTAGPGGVSTGAAHDPATYVKFAETFASLAIKVLAGTGISIAIGIDSGDPTGASDDDWTKNVLADGLADKVDGLANGFTPGFISDHSYMQAPGDESDSFLLDDTVSDSGSVLDWSTRYADYQAVLQQTLGSQASSVQVMATEYNSVWGDPGKQSTSLVNGLFVAESLGSLMDSGYTGGFVWDLRNDYDTSSGQNDSNLLYGWREGGDYGQLGDPNQTDSAPATGPYVAYPGYYALQLASKIIQSGGQVVSAASNYGDLDVYAVMESSGDLELLVINVNPAASLSEQFDLTGFQPSGAAQVWQYGETQDTAQSHSSSGASALTDASASVSLSGGNFSYVFPAYSMTVLDLSPARIVVRAIGGLAAGGTESFAATALDQFGNPLAAQPQFTWSVVGGNEGSISSAGVFRPSYTTGMATIQAAVGSAAGSNVVAIAAAGSQLTISSGLSGAGQSLTVSGSGTVILSGANSYTGGTSVNGGILTIASAAALPGSGVITIGGGGRLVLGSGSGIGALPSGQGALGLSSSPSTGAGSAAPSKSGGALGHRPKAFLFPPRSVRCPIRLRGPPAMQSMSRRSRSGALFQKSPRRPRRRPSCARTKSSRKFPRRALPLRPPTAFAARQPWTPRRRRRHGLLPQTA